jgi:integrase/recombinase XerD
MPARGQTNRSRARPALVSSGDPRELVPLLAVFLEHLAMKNYSPATVTQTDWNLCHFASWCQERALMRPEEINKPILDRYQRFLFHYRSKNGRPLSFRAQHLRLSAIRLFFRWLTKNNYLLMNPASEIELPRIERRLPKHILTVSEAEKVIALPDIHMPLGIRDRAILETLYSTGIRRTELTRLRLYDIDTERGTLMVRQGKGKKDRLIPIGKRASLWIEKYALDIRPSVVSSPDDGTLFLTATGYPFSPDMLGHVVRDYVEKAQLGKTGACHLFRHTMATLMLEGGADVRFIQQMLGHASLETTQIYTHVSIKKLKEIHEATHPGSKLGPPQELNADTEQEPEPNAPEVPGDDEPHGEGEDQA